MRFCSSRKDRCATSSPTHRSSRRLSLEHLEDRLLPSIADGTILVATGPSSFSSQNQSSFPIGLIGVNPHNGSQSQISTAGLFALPTYTAEAPNQVLYVADLTAFGTGAIIAVDPNTGQQTLVAKGGFINGPNALVYRNGYLYVADEGNSTGQVHNIVQVDPNSGAQKLITDGSSGAGFAIPTGMTLAPGNSIYVADEPGNVQGTDPGKVWLISLDSGQQTIVSSNNSTQGTLFNHPVDLALDANGNLIVVNTGGASNNYAGSVIRVNPQTGAQTLISSFGADTGLDSVEVGQDGTIFVGAISSGNTPARIYSVNPATGVQGIVTSGGSLSLVEGIRAFHVTANSSTAVATSLSSSASGQSVTFTATVTGSGPGNPTGVVNFFDGSTSIGQGALVTSGGVSSASFSTATLSTANHVITASYLGDANFNTSTSTALTQTVNQAGTGTMVSASVNPSQSGQAVTFTATLTVSSPGSMAVANPTGVVIFSDGGTSIGQGTLSTSGGATTATFSISSLAVGSHPITASYGGDSNFLASSVSWTHSVNQAGTTVSVTTGTNPAMAGQTVTFTATVSVNSPGSTAVASPTGTVTFMDNGSSIGQGTLSTSGGTTTATFSTSSLSVGSHTLTASYNGDTNFTSSSGTLTETIGMANSTTTVASGVNPSVWGQMVTFTATVTGSGAGNPTGTVIFSDGGKSIGQGTVTTSGGASTASFSTSSLAVGSHPITTSYSGDATFTASSGTLTQTVNQDPTTTGVNTSANPLIGGQLVTLTATINVQNPGSNAPSGTVQFQIDGSNVGNPASVSTSGGVTTASFSTSSLAVGTHTITASYSGDANYTTSSSTAFTETVNKASTSALAVSSANSSVSGQPLTFTATVTGNGPGSPTGVVIFSDGGRSIGQGALTTSAGITTASFSTSSLAVGNHFLTISYSGDSNFLGSAASLTQAVGKASSGVIVLAPASPAVSGQLMTFTATVAVNSPGSTSVANPTGLIIFSDGSTSIGQGTLSSSGGSTSASFSTSSLTVGSHILTATYSGDSNFLASLGTLTQTVNQAATTTVVTSSANAPVFGQPVAFTATVTVNSPGSTAVANPTGMVIFSDGSRSIGQGTLTTSAGITTASFSISSLAVGTHPLTASYSGDSNFLASTVRLTQTVGKASSSVMVVAPSSPAVSGQIVTFTATVTVNSPGSTSVANPTGLIIFSDGSTSIGQGTLSSSGGSTSASFSTSSLTVGSHILTATYSGDSNFLANLGTLTQTVNQAATTTVVTSSANASVFGQPVTFTTTVTVNSPGSTAVANPTGMVIFSDGGRSIGQGTLTTSAGITTASFSISSLAVGTHPLTASYSGDSNFLASTVSLTQMVNQDATTTVVSSSATHSTFGQTVIFTAIVSVQSSGAATPTGTVQFQIDGSNVGRPVSVATSGGVTTASFSTSALAVSTHTITASYSGDTNCIGSTGTLTQTVDEDATSLALTSSITPSVTGQTVSFTANVSVQSPGTGTPTGTVQFQIDGSNAGSPVTLSSSGGVTTALLSTATLGVGTHTITASYGGDGSFAGSSAALTGGQSVNPAGTNTALTSSASSVSGQPVTLTATVAVNGPGGTAVANPTGVVIFADGGTSIGQGILTASGGTTTASFTTSNLAVGNHAITASYTGDSNFLASTAVLTQAVSKANTSTVIASSMSPSVSGQSVTYTATVRVQSPGSGTPTGTVQFQIDGSNAGSSVSLSTSGGVTTATFTTTMLAVSTHSVTAKYSGDGSFAGSSGSTTQMVNMAQTNLQLSTISPSVSGQLATFTAAILVSGSGSTAVANPTGVVSFFDGGTSVGQGTLTTSAGSTTASFSTSSLTVGSHPITASYEGDNNFLASTASATQAVNKANTSTAIVSTANPSVWTQGVTFTATVTVLGPGSTAVASPTGVVIFLDGGTSIGQGTLTTSAGITTASFSTSSLAAGNHNLTASYGGDSNFLGSVGTLIQGVNAASTTSTLVVSPSTVAWGKPITLTANVTSGEGSSDTVTGSVTFLDQGSPLATVALSGGTATWTTSNLFLGGHTLSAAYSGDANHTASSSAAVAVMVGTPDERFVGNLYQSLLHRQPEAAGLAAWTAALNQGVSRFQVAFAFTQSLEYHIDQVQALYQQLLHRNVDPSGLNTYATFLAAGGTVEAVGMFLTSSVEYWQVRAGGTQNGFVTALYHDVLNRSPDAGGLAVYSQALQLGASRLQVAAAFFSSAEYQYDLIGNFYALFLKRAADSGGLNAFVSDLRAGVPDPVIIAAILGSDEFFAES